jgi:tRNA threonylcarbamoyladenosine biosynthesis protein TsaB
MLVLGLETATSYGSVALVGPEGLLAEATALVPMRHLEWLIPAIDRVLADAGVSRTQVEGLAVSQGPGAFTGLRIGIATATAWARASGVPVVGISTLEALAAAAGASGLVVPVLDAKRGEVAAAVFRREDGHHLTRVHEDTVLPPEALRGIVPGGEPVLLVGDGLARWPDVIRQAVPGGHLAPPPLWVPRAAVTAALGRERLLSGQRDDPYRLGPVYGRRPAIA